MAYIWIVIAGVTWGLIGLFTKAISAFGFQEMEMLFVKVAISTVILAGIMLVKDRRSFLLKKWTDFRYFIGTGIVSFTFFSWCYMRAVNLTSVGVAVVLLYTAPTIVMVFSVLFLKEQMTKRKYLVIVMTLLGCVLVSGVLGADAKLTATGIFVGLCSGFGYALYSIFGSFAIRRGYQSMTISFYTFLCATCATAFFVQPVEVVQKITAQGQWGFAFGFAVLTTVVPYLCYTKGLTGLSASKAAVTATIEPVVAAILGIIFLQESATPMKILGIILVVGAVVVMNWDVKPRVEENTNVTM